LPKYDFRFPLIFELGRVIYELQDKNIE
jgi:hypothetical protein